ncbi:hypothetical protein [Hyphomicrobium sp.]|jgi:hypothetical protein|uniref:hypothetical protein n=1 Tax=Hyphomicrobium sp. TaxID=82 RepID=UPI00356199A6
MKALAATAVACMMIASAAAAADGMDGRNRGGRDGGWGPNNGVVVDVPWSAINNPDNSGIPPRSNYEIHCRDVRHSCFDQWGVSEPGYGQCMAARGC